MSARRAATWALIGWVVLGVAHGLETNAWRLHDEERGLDPGFVVMRLWGVSVEPVGTECRHTAFHTVAVAWESAACADLGGSGRQVIPSGGDGNPKLVQGDLMIALGAWALALGMLVALVGIVVALVRPQVWPHGVTLGGAGFLVLGLVLFVAGQSVLAEGMRQFLFDLGAEPALDAFSMRWGEGAVVAAAGVPFLVAGAIWGLAAGRSSQDALDSGRALDVGVAPAPDVAPAASLGLDGQGRWQPSRDGAHAFQPATPRDVRAPAMPLARKVATAMAPTEERAPETVAAGAPPPASAVSGRPSGVRRDARMPPRLARLTCPRCSTAFKAAMGQRASCVACGHTAHVPIVD